MMVTSKFCSDVFSTVSSDDDMTAPGIETLQCGADCTTESSFNKAKRRRFLEFVSHADNSLIDSVESYRNSHLEEGDQTAPSEPSIVRTPANNLLISSLDPSSEISIGNSGTSSVTPPWKENVRGTRLGLVCLLLGSCIVLLAGSSLATSKLVRAKEEDAIANGMAEADAMNGEHTISVIRNTTQAPLTPTPSMEPTLAAAPFEAFPEEELTDGPTYAPRGGFTSAPTRQNASSVINATSNMMTKEDPSRSPSGRPTYAFTDEYSAAPSEGPLSSDFPSTTPSFHTTNAPMVSIRKSDVPSVLPSAQTKKEVSTSSDVPSDFPSAIPSIQPATHSAANNTDDGPSLLFSQTSQSSKMPSDLPSQEPSFQPTRHPIATPSNLPSDFPSEVPST